MFETFHKYFSNLKDYFKKSNKVLIWGFISFTLLGISFRLWNIGFGLPHSYYADEPELTGFAIHYSVELKNALLNEDWFKLVPVSYVYGTFPAYLLVFFIIPYTKLLNVLSIPFDTNSIYLYSRIVLALISFLIVPLSSYLYYRLFNNKFGSLVVFGLLSLNWKLISHAHYANADIILTLLLISSLVTLYEYFKTDDLKDTKFTILTGLFFGFAVGTKITALITLPLYLFIFLYKKDFRGLVAFCFLVGGAFILSNPFSLIFINDFIYRIYLMLTKEAGMVFDSVDYSYLKYIFSLSLMLTFPIFILSCLGIYKTFQNISNTKNLKETLVFHKFLLLNIVFYLVFYSIQSRRVDRWLLPLLPVFIIYASFYFMYLINWFNDKKSNIKFLLKLKVSKNVILYSISVFILVYYLYFVFVLLLQFQPNTPKSSAYLWLRDNVSDRNYFERVLVYSEEGLDPLSKLKHVALIQFKVYESAGASLFYPGNPYYFKYIVVSSRTMENFKHPEVIRKYPYYAEKWFSFESVLNSRDFRLVKKFELVKPNLIPLSDVYIYENLRFSEYEKEIIDFLNENKKLGN